MRRKILAIIIILILAVLAGGFWFVKNNKINEVKNIVTQKSKQEEIIKSEINSVAGLETYTNKDYEYSFDYPADWILTDYYNEILTEVDNKKIEGRYVSFETSGRIFNVEIGVKNKDEGEQMFTHSWYTGIPAGNFFRGNKIEVSEGVAEKQILAYDPADISPQAQTKMYYPSETLGIRLVFYCNVTQDKKITECNDFQIGGNLVAHAEIHYNLIDGSEPTKLQWTNIEEQTEKILKSLRFTE
ncbi:MAG: hypothetical protein UR60_C0028G0027 [Candidatus Moranbacteria bacterium GW2011_GWF2_34_56]|nr:MAG: hypothetical protein UR51_C0002G0147 [Candidatus Moranbacteria bacterium GW2011_GWF1_34_10]KKP64147.1 MAG: hypothetical protein UR60_C0028G0027 [Candidatus Moranbacteria bacterium GW2011_GWF2_34_56]HBI17578.1 hypothetical protein [Candidatus Moranbacteria bacterium]